MNVPTCKDCPCYQDDPDLRRNGFDASGWCQLSQDKALVHASDRNWCYMGRLIMAADAQGVLSYKLRKLFDPYARGKVVEGGPF